MRFSSYSTVLKLADKEGYVIVNTKNSSWGVISKEPEITKFKNLLEQKIFDLNDDMVKSLYDKGYIVDDDKNEFQEIKEKIHTKLKNISKTFYALLYVTKQCNFRCIYCPEDHISSNFSDELWDALYLHIKNGLKNGTYKNAIVSFFGGEPLLETKKIIAFMEKLECLKKKYPHFDISYLMTSNGYLLKPNIYDKMSSYGLKNIQITVDGFADIHNKMRPKVNGGETWDTIIKNLDYINSIEKGATITLRTNMNHLNKDEMLNFNNWVKDRYKNTKFNFDINLVVDFSDNVNKEMIADETNPEINQIKAELNAKNDKSNLYGMSEILSIMSMTCKSAQGSFYAITPDWRVAKCENIYKGEDVYWGTLKKDGNIKRYDNMEKWNNSKEDDNCKECIVYPQCAAKMCPYRFANHPESREFCCNMQKESFTQQLMVALEQQLGTKVVPI